jgi:hypothetical protein
MLEKMGIDTAVDLKLLVAASQIIAPYLDHPLPGRYLQSCTRAAAPVAASTATVQ